MKRFFIALIAVLMVYPAGLLAQKKAMIEQIAALQVYLRWLKKGNNILKDGTSLIGSIKKGELGVHTARFDSLKSVNPDIRNSDKVKAILHMHEAMSRARPLIIRKAVESGGFSGAELSDLGGRCADLAEASGKDLDELLLVITPGKVSMSDDERIRIIDRLYAAMGQKYTAQKKLNRYVISLAEQRKQAKTDAKTLRELHGK